MFLRHSGLPKKATARQRGALLRHIHKGQIRALSEIAVNVLRGTVTVQEDLRAFLKRSAKLLRKLASKHTTIAEKRALLTLRLVETLCEAVRERILKDS